jgi:hypothetical protein
MNTDNLLVHNASHPDAEEAGDADAIQGKNKVDEVVVVDDVESKRWKLKILLFVLFVIGTVTALSIVFTRDRNGPTDSPTIDPTKTIRFAEMTTVIGSSFEADFPNSPLQVSALDWLANEDPANLAVDTNPTTLLERFTLALFYFATQGDEWSSQRNFLTVNAVCSWSGLECNDQGILTKIDIGTCLLSSFCLSCKSVRSLTKFVLICPGNRLDFSV